MKKYRILRDFDGASEKFYVQEKFLWWWRLGRSKWLSHYNDFDQAPAYYIPIMFDFVENAESAIDKAKAESYDKVVKEIGGF